MYHPQLWLNIKKQTPNYFNLLNIIHPNATNGPNSIIVGHKYIVPNARFMVCHTCPSWKLWWTSVSWICRSCNASRSEVKCFSCRRSSAVWFGVVGSDYGHNPPLKRISCLLNPIFGWVVPDFIPNWKDHRQELPPSGINQEPEKMPMDIFWNN